MSDKVESQALADSYGFRYIGKTIVITTLGGGNHLAVSRFGMVSLPGQDADDVDRIKMAEMEDFVLKERELGPFRHALPGGQALFLGHVNKMCHWGPVEPGLLLAQPSQKPYWGLYRIFPEKQNKWVTKNLLAVNYDQEEWSRDDPFLFFCKYYHYIESLKPLVSPNFQDRTVGFLMQYISFTVRERFVSKEVEFPYAKWVQYNRANAYLALFAKESFCSDLPLIVKAIILSYIFVEKAGPCSPPEPHHLEFARRQE